MMGARTSTRSGRITAVAAALEHVPQTFYCATEDGRLEYLNAYGRTVLGLSPDRVRSNSVFAINPALAPEQWRTAVQAARSRGRWTLHTHQRIHSGEAVAVEIAIGHQRVGGAERFYCTSRPACAEERSTRLLKLVAQATASRAGRAFFGTLMEHMAKAMQVRHAFITECCGQPPSRARMIAFWSDGGFEENLEYELRGTPCDRVINGRQNILVDRALGERFPSEAGRGESYFGVPLYDSEGREVIGHMALLDDQPMTKGELDYAVFDILASRASLELQRMRAESALRASEEKYRLLVENQTDLIMRLDARGRVTFASPSCCARLGKSEAEMTGRALFDDMHPEDLREARQAWRRTVTSGGEQSVELRTRTAAGWRWFAWLLKTVAGSPDEMSQVVAVGRDVSERRRAEEQARDTVQKLAHVGRLSSMGEVASGIAHELNQPLTAIMTFAQASRRLLDAGEAGTAELGAALERIAANAERAGAIIRRMRAFARKGEPTRVPADLRALIQDVITLLEPDLRHARIRLSCDLQANLPAVLGDPVQIQQVLVNLVRNAIEAIDDHHMQTRQIGIAARMAADGRLLVEVRDSGPGIAQEIEGQLFTAFATTKANGLGIGLSICHTIIEAHGGRLWVASQPGGGAAFCFSLPVMREGRER